MFGKECYSDNNELLNKAFKEKKILIAAHRGMWGGNIPENTIPSFRLALEMGADMFECDVSKSTDGVLYAFHDGYEKRLLGVDQNIQTLSSQEINQLRFFNSIGEPSGVAVEFFETIVSFFKNGELYNVDRSWEKLPETIAVLNKYPWSVKQALIKSPLKDGVMEFFSGCPVKYMYMPIVYSRADVEKALGYPEVNLVGMELIAQTAEDELFSDDIIKYLHSKRLFAWANTITLSNLTRHILYAGLDDDMALLKSKDDSWGKIIQKDIDVIQTDWPLQLRDYRDDNYRRTNK